MIILFLDIDGVLTSLRSMVALGFKGIADKTTFDPLVIKFLNNIFKENKNLQLVVSSTWRRIHKDDLIPILREAGFEGKIHKDWKTPYRFSHRPRGSEIQEWLDDHPKIKQYIILDDDCDMLDSQRSFHVYTTWDDGMVLADMIKTKNLLNSFSKKGRSKDRP